MWQTSWLDSGRTKNKAQQRKFKKNKKKNRRRRSRGNSPGAGEGVCASELSRTPQKVNTNTRSEAPQTPDIMRRAETIDWREEEEQTNVCVCVCVCVRGEREARGGWARGDQGWRHELLTLASWNSCTEKHLQSCENVIHICRELIGLNEWLMTRKLFY